MQTESLQGSVRKSWLIEGETEWQKVHPNGGCKEDELSVSLACSTHQVGGNLQLPTPFKQVDTDEPQHCLTSACVTMPGES